MMKKVIDFVLVFVALAAAAEIVYLLRQFDTHRSEIRQLNAAPPDITVGQLLLPLQGQSMEHSQVSVLPGRARVVVHLSPKCGICAKNVPAWQSVVESIGSENLVIVTGLISEDSVTELATYLRENKLSAKECLLVQRKDLEKRKMLGVPRTLFIDPEGRITRIWKGVIDSTEVVEAWRKSQGDS